MRTLGAIRRRLALQVLEFNHASIFRVLIASYETLRKHTADLRGHCDLLVCDEGGRLPPLDNFPAPPQRGTLFTPQINKICIKIR